MFWLAVSTGGFASHDASAAALPVSARAVLAVLSVAGAVSLLLIWRAVAERRPGLLANDGACRALLVLIALVTVAIGLSRLLVAGEPPALALAQAAQLAVWTQTTTGFSAIDVASLDPANPGGADRLHDDRRRRRLGPPGASRSHGCWWCWR